MPHGCPRFSFWASSSKISADQQNYATPSGRHKRPQSISVVRENLMAYVGSRILPPITDSQPPLPATAPPGPTADTVRSRTGRARSSAERTHGSSRRYHERDPDEMPESFSTLAITPPQHETTGGREVSPEPRSFEWGERKEIPGSEKTVAESRPSVSPPVEFDPIDSEDVKPTCTGKRAGLIGGGGTLPTRPDSLLNVDELVELMLAEAEALGKSLGRINTSEAREPAYVDSWLGGAVAPHDHQKYDPRTVSHVLCLCRFSSKAYVYQL